MLGKLFKYDMKSFMRILLPVYGAILALSVVIGLMVRFSEDSFFEATGMLFSIIMILFFVSITGSVIITIIILIQSYYKNLLGEQGYLMFALPVETRTLVASKIFSAGLIVFLGGVVGILSFCIVLFTQIGTDGFEWITAAQWREGWRMFLQQNNLMQEFILPIILGLIAAIMGCFSAVARIYTAISVGHLWSNHRTAGSVLAYIGISIVESIVLSFLGDTSVMGIIIFDSINRLNISANAGLGVMIFIYAALAVIHWFISWLILDRKLNLA